MNNFRIPGPGLHSVTIDDGRRVAFSIPESVGGPTRLPLVMAMHWGGPLAPWTGMSLLETLVLPGLGALDALFVAPDRNCDRWDCPQSEAEVMGLLDMISSASAVDQDRIIVTGYSLGGIGTWYLAGKHPDRFRAAIPVSARAPQGAGSAPWKVPTRVVHGSDDELFPVSHVINAVAVLKKAGADIDLDVMEGATHFEVPRYSGAMGRLVPWLGTI